MADRKCRVGKVLEDRPARNDVVGVLPRRAIQDITLNESRLRMPVDSEFTLPRTRISSIDAENFSPYRLYKPADSILPQHLKVWSRCEAAWNHVEIDGRYFVAFAEKPWFDEIGARTDDKNIKR